MAQVDFIAPLERTHQLPVVRTITPEDLRIALKRGVEDFRAMPSHAFFVGLLYAVSGLVLIRAASGAPLIPLLYPLAAGFALIGPFAAIGLYEMSRRPELGHSTSWQHVFDIRHSPSFLTILTLGALLLVLFVIWIAIARSIYVANFGYAEPDSLFAFVSDIMTTDAGTNLILTGNAVGFLFALAAFSLSAISFPLLLDRNVGFAAAIITSVKVILRNPLTMALWGLIVAGGLAAGFALMLFGLAVVIPVLGHATWHLYRRAVEPDDSPRPKQYDAPRGTHYAADFPASLFFPTNDRPKTPDGGTQT